MVKFESKIKVPLYRCGLTWRVRLDGNPVTADSAEFDADEEMTYEVLFGDGHKGKATQSIPNAATAQRLSDGWPQWEQPLDETWNRTEDEHKVSVCIDKLNPITVASIGNEGTETEKNKLTDRIKNHTVKCTIGKTVTCKFAADGKDYECAVKPKWVMELKVKDGAVDGKSYSVSPELDPVP